MLYMWSAIASPFTYQWVLKVLPALHIAAELALHVLTGSEGGGLACDLNIHRHSVAVQHAGVAIQVVGRCLDEYREAADDQAQRSGFGNRRYPGCPEPALVSDVVQKALVLHLCILVRGLRDKQQQQDKQQQGGHRISTDSSSIGSWAPAEATNLLQQLGVPQDAVQPYTYAVPAAFSNTLLQQTDVALTCLAGSIKLRTIALSDPGWTQRYSGFIAAAAPDSWRGDDAIEHTMIGPEFHIGQITSLAIEYAAVSGLGPERVNPAIIGLQMVSSMLMLTMGQYQHPEQFLHPEQSVRERYTEGCLEQIWSGLGKQLLRVSGVAEAELEGDGSQLAASAAAGGGGDAVGSSFTADEVIDRMRATWHKYKDCLFYAIRVYKECFDKLPFQLYMRQPMRASRVVEAAIRASQHGSLITGLTSPSDSMVLLLEEIHHAVDVTSPDAVAAATNLLQNKRMTVRCCCQLVSTLKAISQPLNARVDRQAVMLQQVQIASLVAVAGPNVHSWAIGKLTLDIMKEMAIRGACRVVHAERLRGANGTPATAVSAQDALSAPCYPAWLAITGRALLTLGRLFQDSAPWLQSRLQETTSGRRWYVSHFDDVMRALSQHAYAVDWLCKQLNDLKKHPDAPAALNLPPGMLEDLTQLASSLAPKFQALLLLCQTALDHMAGPGPWPLVCGPDPEGKSAEAAVFKGFLQGSAERWLHDGLQELGTTVWAAWPQKYACNDDACLEMRGLDEHSCISGGRLRCSSCKVAYYCCKQHQTRHWPQHKKVCGHLKVMARQAA